jgi:hypothetical protein
MVAFSDLTAVEWWSGWHPCSAVQQRESSYNKNAASCISEECCTRLFSRFLVAEVVDR